MGFDAGRVPRSIRAVAALSLVAGVVMIFLGGFRIGVTSDEPLHVQRFNNYLATGWYLGDGQVADGEPIDGMKQQYVYAPATTLFLHGLGVIAGVDDRGSADSTAAAYAVRHLGVGLIGLLGMLAVAATARLLLGNWEWGLVAAAIMVAVPLWAGHSMFNVKDVPVASGYALATLGLVIIAREDRSASRMLVLGGPVALAMGTFMCVGTRPGMWAGIAASCGMLGICWSYARYLRRPGQGAMSGDLWRLRDVTVAMGAAGAGLWAIYPQVFGSPVEALVRSASGSTNFISISSSWSFIPSRVAFQVPLMILVLIGLGTVVAIRELVASRRSWDALDTGLVLVLVQMFVLPVIGIVKGASLYGDLRQVLFALPASTIVGTVGAAWLVALVRRRNAVDRTGVPLVSGMVCVALVLPMADQALSFPYNYAHYNPLAQVTGLNVLGDYYRASARELVPELPTTGRIVCSPEEDGAGGLLRVAHLDGWVNCTETGSLLEPYADERRGEYPELRSDEFWAITFSSIGAIGGRCVREASTSRRTLLGRLGLATLARCRTPFPVLSDGLVRFRSDSDLGYALPDHGWRSFGVDGTETGLLFADGPATMTFGLASSMKGRTVRLTFDVNARQEIGVRFGDTSLDFRWLGPDALTWTVDIPPALVAQAITEPVSLELRPLSDPPGILKLESLRVETLPIGQ